MKANTEVFVSYRNIGDSTDRGELFAGPLRDAMMWLMTRVGATTMATRIVVGIGRDEAGARQATETRRSGTRLDANEFAGDLDRLLAGESVDDIIGAEADPLDTWKGSES